MSKAVQESRINSIDAIRGLPRGLSFFDPILLHEAKEALEADGEVYTSCDPSGPVNGLFIYDNFEATGTVFTKSREVFDHFFDMKPDSYIFSELDIKEYPKENWNIWQLDVENAPLGYRFKHHASIDSNAEELERYMAIAQPETNRKWVKVALDNGDKCFVVKIHDRIVGIAWMEIVGSFARSHGLHVDPMLRRTGIMTDNFHARLIYLKSRNVRTLINEIAESNIPSSSHAKKIGEKIVGKIYLYSSFESEEPALSVADANVPVGKS